MTEFERLLSLPRLCRSCGAKSSGLRCGDCYRLRGRITRILRTGNPEGMSEEEIARHLQLETILRREESSGSLHEKPTGWSLGLHPEQVSLLAALEDHKRARAA